MTMLVNGPPVLQHPARSIAVVDDNRGVREAIGSLLHSRGYQVQLFGTASALLSCAMLGQFDCIVSDVQMPGMNGLQLLEALRLADHRTPLVLMTAVPDHAMRQRALDGGACCFLSKPFLAGQLIDSIVAALGSADAG